MEVEARIEVADVGRAAAELTQQRSDICVGWSARPIDPQLGQCRTDLFFGDD
jgi:hypothetical protein